MKTRTLCPYQVACHDTTISAFERHRRVLNVLPTGTGKTVVFAKVAETMRERGRVLVLAHREELIEQARNKIGAWTSLTTAVEMGQQRAYGSLGAGADVVVASIQTLSRPARLERFKSGDFGLVIVDEAHHAPAETYQRVIDHFAEAKVLGMTATPDRLDKTGLETTFDTAGFVYELRDAIHDRWLVPIRQLIAHIDGLDISSVRTVAGDFNEQDLEREMIQADSLHGVAKATVAAAGPDRKALVFATTIAHAHALAETFGHYTDRAGVLALSGQDSDENRKEGLRRFANGDVRFLVNCLLFTEGFDQPDIGLVAIARPTKSRALYSQMVGRGTRTWCPKGCDGYCDHEERKPDLIIVDFAGNAGNHALVNCVDILGGNADHEIRARVMRRLAKADAVDVLSELDEQQRQMAESLRREALEAAKRERERQALEAAKDERETTVAFTEVDPFTTVFSVLKVRPIAGLKGGLEPTPAQVDELKKHKVDVDLKAAFKRLDRGQADEILAAIRSRHRNNLCTYKQARVLVRFGFNPDVSFGNASAIMDALAQNNWRPLPPAEHERLAAAHAPVPAPTQRAMPEALLADLCGRGFALRLVDGDTIRVTPGSKLTPDDVAAIREAKVALVDLLKAGANS